MKRIINQKRFFFLILINSFLLINSLNSLGSEEVYEISYSCPRDCIKDNPVSFYINVSNYGDYDMGVVMVRVIDSITKSTISRSEEADLTVSDPAAIGSDKPKLINIAPGKKAYFNIEGVLPKANNKDRLDYQFCITRKNPLEVWDKEGPTTEFCYKDGLYIKMTECKSDEHCNAEEYCLENKCRKLECDSCQYIENHECLDYECCQNEHCRNNERCLENKCEKVICNSSISAIKGNELILDDKASQVKTQGELEDNIKSDENEFNNQTEEIILMEYLVNHSCRINPCKDNEIIMDFMCVKNNCSFDEFIFNYSCKKLNCSFDEEYYNHTCRKLRCNESFEMKNHECVPLECKDDEFLFNHSCSKLKCNFFQTPENHECLINSVLFIELILVIIGLFLFIIDYLNFQKRRKRNLARKLMKKAKDRIDKASINNKSLPEDKNKQDKE